MAIIRSGNPEQQSFGSVYAALRDHLLSGALKTGDKLLPERDLAIQLGVSRPMLREALRALAVLGVVEVRQGAGTVVRRPDVSMLGDFFAFIAHHHETLVDDVMQARIAIECQAIRLACKQAGVAGLGTLRGALDEIVATIDNPLAGGLADHAFHSEIVAMARSETLATLYAAIGNLLLRSHGDRRASVFGTPDGRTYLIDHHRLILEAVAAGDPDQADAVLREHFTIGDEYRRRNVATRPNLATEDITA